MGLRFFQIYHLGLSFTSPWTRDDLLIPCLGQKIPAAALGIDNHRSLQGT